MDIPDLHLETEEIGARPHQKKARDFVLRNGYEKYVKGEDGLYTKDIDPDYYKNREQQTQIERKVLNEIIVDSEKQLQEATDEREELSDTIDRLKQKLKKNKTRGLDNFLGVRRRSELKIDELQEQLKEYGKAGERIAAFANISKEDVNELWYAQKVINRRANKKADEERKKRFYNLRAFNHSHAQNEIHSKIDKLEHIPHMTKEQRDEWMEKKRTRKIYTDADVPDKLSLEERKSWLQNKNKKQKLYLQADSG